MASLTWFAHISRHGSFTKAANEMDVTRGALSQQLKGLEQSLGVRLMHRTTRSMSLTAEGRALFDVLQPALADVERALAEVGEAGQHAAGLVRISSSRPAARRLVEPHLGALLRRHPRLRVELVLEDGFSNIVAEGLDLGIRLGRSLDEHVVAVPITPPLRMAIVGSPSYFEAHGVPETPDDLSAHNCLAYRFSTSGAIDRWAFAEPGGEGHPRVFEPRGSAIFNDDESMLQAALQGVGLVQHMDLWVQPYLADGSLMRVLLPWCRPFPGFHLYVPTRAQLPAKTRAVMDFLIEQRKRLESERPFQGG